MLFFRFLIEFFVFLVLFGSMYSLPFSFRYCYYSSLSLWAGLFPVFGCIALFLVHFLSFSCPGFCSLSCSHACLVFLCSCSILFSLLFFWLFSCSLFWFLSCFWKVNFLFFSWSHGFLLLALVLILLFFPCFAVVVTYKVNFNFHCF